MELNNLKPAEGSVKSTRRIARGVGSGSGRTAGRGHKGAKARAGYSSKRAFQGGQMPLQKKVPKRGFKNVHRRYQSSRPGDFAVLNLYQLAYYISKNNLTEVTPQILAKLGIVEGAELFKVLGDGKLDRAIDITANRFSASAKKAITEAGGKAFIEFKLNELQGIALAEKTDKVDLNLIRKYFEFVNEDDCIHVIADGTISNKLTLEVNKISPEAKAQVQALGGSVTLV